jgi:hypothetical protein
MERLVESASARVRRRRFLMGYGDSCYLGKCNASLTNRGRFLDGSLGGLSGDTVLLGEEFLGFFGFFGDRESGN